MIKKAIILALVISANATTYAQTVTPPSETTVNIELIGGMELSDEVLDTLTDPMYLLSPGDTLMLSVSMLLHDTMSVNNIHVKLGTTQGADDLLSHTYPFDNINPGGLLNYFRDGDMLDLGMGSYINSGVFYCEIILEDTDGNLSIAQNAQSDQ